MAYGKAEDAGGLSPAKDDNAAVHYFIRRTLPILDRVDYIHWPPQYAPTAKRWGRIAAGESIAYQPPEGITEKCMKS